ncbi:LysR family transcriptional regulator [Vibrio maritimus]|uniref:LysR family transcriptional regulator n=1 Tax=Vibrio maritimus TaxID=990268 RepID=UPI00406862E2
MKYSDFSLLPIFTTIFEEKNYTKASKRLNISQPAVSQSVEKLRVLFDDTLFVRVKNGVEPTQLAKDIYPELSELVCNIRCHIEKHKTFNPKVANRTFRIATSNLISDKILPNLIRTIDSCAPNLILEHHDLTSIETGDLLRRNTCDLVIDAKYLINHNFKSEVIDQETIVTICRAEHPRLKGRFVSKEAFLNEHHVELKRYHNETGFSLLLIESICLLLRQRKINRVVDSFLSLISVVCNSDNIAILPLTIAKQYEHSHNIRILDTEIFEQDVEINMLWNPSQNSDPSHRWLRDTVRKSVRSY